MKITREARKTARALFQLSLAKGCIEPARAEEIAATLLAEKPRSYVQILKEFTRLVRLDLSRRHAVIESATPLESAVSSGLEQSLHQKFGTDITTEFRVNTNLIGGLRIQFGSDVWDGSIRSRLDALQKQL